MKRLILKGIKIRPIKIIKHGETPKYSYKIGKMPGEYSIEGYDKTSGKYILKKLKGMKEIINS